ncbi:MAG: aminotransferase class V-fold PLP-dependent enzyme [Actinomycetota bacterium]|nr:aminotransferase class V-fold PLP-dependent enzyme [Actinomycetota bacterium]
MHSPSPEEEKIAAEVSAWVVDRLTYREDTLPARRVRPLPPIGPVGIGAAEAWGFLHDQVLSTAVPTDHPRYLAFVGGAPTVMSVMADMAMSAAAVYAGSSLEGGAVVEAEGAALRWLARAAGLPASAFGTFVSGGSIANLSALVAARFNRRRVTGHQPTVIVAGSSAHASVASAAQIMGCELITDGDWAGRLDRAAMTRILMTTRIADIAAVVATAGATNTGTVDDLAGISDLCRQHGLWMHVDAAYGGAALLSERTRALFRGIEEADSITIDPHKWLFTPLDCAAVIYRNPELARSAHTQVASYLEPVSGDGHDNPSDYAIHLTRRGRGVPLWLSLLANGTSAYCTAVENCLALAAYAVHRIHESGRLEIVGNPALSVVLFRRVGWTQAQYYAWSARALSAGLCLVTPTEFDGETVLRFCFVNPLTIDADIDDILVHIN